MCRLFAGIYFPNPDLSSPSELWLEPEWPDILFTFYMWCSKSILFFGDLWNDIFSPAQQKGNFFRAITGFSFTVFSRKTIMPALLSNTIDILPDLFLSLSDNNISLFSKLKSSCPQDKIDFNSGHWSYQLFCLIISGSHASQDFDSWLLRG